MNFWNSLRTLCLLLLGTVVLLVQIDIVEAGQYLIADRMSNRVLRYSEGGAFLGVLIDDSVNLNQPAGITISPDESKLYITSRLNSRVVEYNYFGSTATFSQSISSATASPSTINAPASVLFSQDASRLYVSNLGAAANATTVAQLTPAGASAGADLTGGPATGRSGMAWNPSGELLVGSYGFSPVGGVLRYDTGTSAFVNFVTPVAELRGAANLLVNGDDLYVAAGFGGRLGKFDANTGLIDTSFGTDGYVSGLAFPASLALDPDGQSLLLGILGATNGSGRIDRYDLDGNLLGTFANNSNANPALGFREATGIAYSTVVPEPASAVLGMLAIAAVGALARGRRQR